MDDKVIQAGQVNIIGCDILTTTGAGLEVTSLAERISIYEDITSPFISGEIVLRDTYDIPNTIGRSDRNLIRLVINTPSLPESSNIQGYFLIYDLVDRQLASDRSQLYTYRFVSEEMVYDAQKRISKTYRGTGDTIIKEILEEKLVTKKTLKADEAPVNQITYTSNFWSPTQNIRYCIENSKDSQGNASYLFFENRNGFNFTPLTSMKKGDPMQYFAASDFSTDVDTDTGSLRFGSASRNPNNDYSVIREIRVDSTFNYLDFLSKGGARTSLYTHDLTTKKINIMKYELVRDKHTLLNKNRFLSDSAISNTEPIIMTAPKYWSALDEGDKTNTSFLQNRVSQLTQFNAFKIEIDVFGRTDYTVGSYVVLDLNQIRAISRDEDKDLYIDKMYSGVYIVSKIAHHITRKEHKCTLELIKDSTDLS